MTTAAITLPLTRSVRFAHGLTWAIAMLLFLSSIAGLGYGRAGLYEDDAMLPALLGQDGLTLLFGIPLLLVSAAAARRGSLRALLCWMGALFYVAYFWYFYVVGIRFTPLFPVHVAAVSMSMYGALYLLFSLDLEALKRRFDEGMPVRLIGGFLVATAVVFAALWTVLIVSELRAGRELGAVPRLVIAIDGVVLLPLSFFGGIWLWRREPIGYAVASLLLVKLVATFLTLIVTAGVTTGWQAPDQVQTTLYLVGLLGSLGLLVRCLQSVIEPPGLT